MQRWEWFLVFTRTKPSRLICQCRRRREILLAPDTQPVAFCLSKRQTFEWEKYRNSTAHLPDYEHDCRASVGILPARYKNIRTPFQRRFFSSFYGVPFSFWFTCLFFFRAFRSFSTLYDDILFKFQALVYKSLFVAKAFSSLKHFFCFGLFNEKLFVYILSSFSVEG